MRLSDLLRAKARSVQEEQPVEQAINHAERSGNDQVVLLDLASIQPNPYQPRREFSDVALADLARSIEEHGLLQPVVVRRVGDSYQLLLGERRLRACERLGWKRIPAIVRDMDDRDAAVVALIENLQREDLDLAEEIEAVRRLRDDFGLTQMQIAQLLGLNQSTVALESTELQREVLKEVIESDFNVKETEALVQNEIEQKRTSLEEKKQTKRTTSMDPSARLLFTCIQRLIEGFVENGTEVEVQQSETDGYVEMRLRIQTGKEY